MIRQTEVLAQDAHEAPRMIRRTEVIAQETLFGTGEHDPGLLNRLLVLCSGQPTAAELDDALCLMSPIAATLKAWRSSQHLIMAKAEGTAAFHRLHPGHQALGLALAYDAHEAPRYSSPVAVPATVLG